MRRKKRNSRVVTGFHRLGTFLAVPFLLTGVVIGVSAFWSEEGPTIEDPLARKPPLEVTIPTAEKRDQLRQWINAGTLRLIDTVKIDTGPVRTLTIYAPTGDLPVKHSGANDYEAPLESFFDFEWRRGSILRPEEEPVVVGDFIVEEQLDLRENSFAKWSHLTRGFDWQRVILGASIAGLSVLIYLLSRAFGWIINGFTSSPTD